MQDGQTGVGQRTKSTMASSGPTASLNIILSPRLVLVQRYFLAHEPCARECWYPLDELDKGSHMRHCPLRESQPVVAVA